MKSQKSYLNIYNSHKNEIEKIGFKLLTTFEEVYENIKRKYNKAADDSKIKIVFDDEKENKSESKFKYKYRCPNNHISEFFQKTIIDYINRHGKYYDNEEVETIKDFTKTKEYYIALKICQICSPYNKLTRYKDFIEEMAKFNYKVVTSYEEFVDKTKKVSIMCPIGHIINDVIGNTWHTKSIVYKNDIEKKNEGKTEKEPLIPCKMCSNGGHRNKKLNKTKNKIKKILDERKITFISYDPRTRKVKYLCPICMDEQEVCKATLYKYENWRGCSDCNPNPQAYTQEEAYLIYEYYGCKLLSKYINNVTRNMYICVCKKEAWISLKDLRRGRLCYFCGIERRLKNYIEYFQRNYGVDNAMQVAEYFYNHTISMYKFKEFRFPSGEIVRVLGYENLCLADLIKEGYTYNDLTVDQTKIPKILYTKHEHTNISRYYPDIFFPEEKRIIEVKSAYTYTVDYKNNILKAKQCVKDGYKYEFWIYDREEKSYIIEILENDKRILTKFNESQINIFDFDDYKYE